MKTSLAIFLVILAELAVALLGINHYGWGIEGLQATTRFSGRLSLLIFSFIFLLHPENKSTLSRSFSSGYFMVFAIAHGIHLLELLTYVKLAGIELVPYRVAGGFLAYAFIFVMPHFQFQYYRRPQHAAKYRRIGLAYLFYVWFIFFMTYLSRVNGSFPNAEHKILFGWVIIMLIFKLIRGFSRKPIFS